MLNKLLKSHPGLRAEIDDLRRMPDLLADGYDVALIKTSTQLPDGSAIGKRIVSATRTFFAAAELATRLGPLDSPEQIRNWPVIADADEPHWDLFSKAKRFLGFPSHLHSELRTRRCACAPLRTA